MPEPAENTAEAPAQEPAPVPEAAPAAEDELTRLRARVAELEAEVARRQEEATEAVARREREMKETLARLQADFDNFRRRSREDIAQSAGRGKEALLKALLPAFDNLDRAVAFSEDAGVKMVARQLQDILAAQGVQAVNPEGEAFDANLHEAIAREAREGVKPGTVLAVAEKGYVLDGRVVRPARVVVADEAA